MKSLGIIGADGRMGRAVEARVQGAYQDQYRIGTRVTRDDPAFAALAECDAVIDFSASAALIQALPHLRDGVPLISGTTGLSDAEEKTLQDAAKTRPILRSGNFSLGIAVLSHLARQAVKRLGSGWDVEILEMHHRHKTDAPSGTALMLGEAVADGRGVSLPDKASHIRSGQRRDGDIGFAVLRGGGVYGMHEVRIVSESEMITLGHQALNRDVFADGALAGLGWLIGQSAGFYSMQDVIGQDVIGQDVIG